MARIRVDTNQLRSQAGSFESLAESIGHLGSDLYRLASSMPSYDGQLSGPARAAGLELQRQTQSHQRQFSDLHASLLRTAQAFEKVDLETLTGLQSCTAEIIEQQQDDSYSLLFGSHAPSDTTQQVLVSEEPCAGAQEREVAQARQFLKEAGVALEGNWTDAELLAAAKAVYQVGQKFKDKLAAMGYPTVGVGEAFRMVFGDMTFYYGDKPAGALPLSGFWGRSGAHNITFQPGKVTPRLVEHELGHEFAFLLYDEKKGYAKLPHHPLSMLINQGVWSNGEFVTGNRNGSYDRNGGLSAADGNGYRSDNYLDEWQYHPRSMGDDGNSADEDWADIFLNWSNDSFADNPHGKSLFDWTDSNMEMWLREALVKQSNLGRGAGL
jgi:hypothetical protein